MSGIIFNLFIFVLASFVGYLAISKVPPTLHTPLMSGANAISGITIIGALIIAGQLNSSAARIIGFVAIIFATINVVGGFAVTDRMLEMFKKKDEKGGAVDE
ncbi:MAG TPA: NAD(P) transhydrogenase subunit alpha [Balneolaceae bacterium]|nr:NAD(P) transhydrogenase subunit alpha [Balneolaceae bacterium]